MIPFYDNPGVIYIVKILTYDVSFFIAEKLRDVISNISLSRATIVTCHASPLYLPCEHFNGRNSLLYHLIYPHFAWVVTKPIMPYGVKNRHKRGLSSKSPKFDDSISISLS
jgi:hypothetical protein